MGYRFFGLIAVVICSVFPRHVRSESPDSPELKRAFDAAADRCSDFRGTEGFRSREVDCWNEAVRCRQSANGSDVLKFNNCFAATPFGVPNQRPAQANSYSRGDKLCMQTRIPGIAFGQQVNRAANVTAFVEEVTDKRIKLSVGGIQIVKANFDAEYFQATGSATYNGAALIAGNTFWIEASSLSDWHPCD